MSAVNKSIRRRRPELFVARRPYTAHNAANTLWAYTQRASYRQALRREVNLAAIADTNLYINRIIVLISKVLIYNNDDEANCMDAGSGNIDVRAWLTQCRNKRST